MVERLLTLRHIGITFALMLCWTLALAQGKPDRPSTWTQPMTAWGEPDLRGTWPLNHLISTPFQRPEKFGDRRFLTDEEFAAAQKSAEDRNARFLSGAIPQADAGQATRQTSLMIDPPNGRFPELTPKGKALYDQMRGRHKPGQTVFDSPEDFDSWDRCITRGLPVSMLPRNYNNGIRIMQFPGYVVILLEMAPEARLSPTHRAARTLAARCLNEAVSGRIAGTLGRPYPGRRNDELQRKNRNDQRRGSRVSAADAVHGESARDRALCATRRRHHRLSDHGRGPGGADDRFVVGGLSTETRQRLPSIRV